MGVLRKKEERTETVTVRVPSRVKADLDRLREETSVAGFDLNATLSEAVVRVTKQIREEILEDIQVLGIDYLQVRPNIQESYGSKNICIYGSSGQVEGNYGIPELIHSPQRQQPGGIILQL